MKISNYSKLAAALTAAATLILSGCNKKPEETPPAKPPAKPAKPAVTPEEDTTPEETTPPTPTPTPAPAPKASSLEKQINGSWSLSPESILAMMQGDGAATPGPAEIAVATMMAGLSLFELNDGKAVISTPDGVENETYTFVSTDDSAGTFVVNMVDADGTEERGEGTIDGDMMTMTKDGKTMKLTRITAAEGAKRKKAIAAFDPSSLIPPGVVPPDVPGEIPVPPVENP